jgi:DNA-binding transcriptional LysR family regulator
MLKIQQLQQFVIAATTGSFKAAAASTFRSQAAVSIAMRELERAIGGRLIERDRRGKFTPLALAILPLFQELLTVHDLVLSQSRELASGLHGSLTVAVAPFLAEQWMPEVIAQFAEQYPGIRIRTIEERSSRIRGLVADGSVNIGIAGLLSDDPRLNIRPVARETYGVLCRPDHRFASRASVHWSALKNERIIGSDALDALFAAGLVPRLPAPDLVMTSRTPLLACVRKRLGITVLPMLTRPGAADGLAFVALTRPKLARTVAILSRSSESLLPAGRRLVDMLADSLLAFAQGRGAAAVQEQR